ncbi:thiol-disulfide oxidoreductase [Aquisphaera giovannonii]|uniref:Thiol-disulfide oxidoreductase n=1 Tax=Aquisphaera giovannonii TaxID=406548 RepID=A0A5B9WE53_9BACT|nr:carboxypeptidase regulatory-like domain-containing protein [Aquisphaera giovannonii]QEH38509.1 thiol-disulfide oxidoreductase [Aquisphaera giovannonii]
MTCGVSTSGARLRAGLCVLALLCPALAAAEGPADAPLPEVTATQLAAKLREAMARNDDRGTIRVLFTNTQDINFRGTGEPNWVSYRGRARYEGDGTRWRVEYDAMIPNANVGRTMPRLSPDRWSTGFDGERLYDLQASRNTLQLGATTISAMLWKPRYLIWERSQDLPETLEGVGKQEVSISQRVVDGVRCYAVESKSTTARGYGGEWLLAPKWGYLPISRKWTHDGKAYSIRTLQGVHEAAPGLWAPERIEEESLNVRGPTPQLNSRRRIQVLEYRPGAAPPAAAFELKIPYGIDVVELANGWSYHNDPWWPDVAPMLRDKYGWPKPNLSWLTFLGSGSEKKLDGEPAPPLRIKEWVTGGPMDLTSLRGKVTLIEFGSVLDSHYAPRYAVALRELYAAYHAAGLEILSFQGTSREEVAEIRRFAKEFRVPYPIVLDDDRTDPAGDTAKAFAIRGRICAFLIDHEGKVRSVGEPTMNGGHVLETVVAALQKAGARDLKALSLEMPKLPVDAYRDAEALFRAKAKEALGRNPAGKIAGRIVDEKGRPIAGATVQASLQFTFLIFAEPGGYYLASYQRPEGPFAAESDGDGRFEIPGLCKGGYLVKVTAPGRAWAERKVFVGPDLAPAPADFEMKQGDTIAGVVRDRQGKPVAGATVTPDGRQNFVGDEMSSTVHPHIPGVTTGDDGRFRFSNLQEGRYLLKIEAPGFKPLEPDAIPAGTQDATLTLEPGP